MPNIDDVAKKANVSKNTVSRYLNNRGYIADKTKIRIQKAIDDLNYIPNQVARNLYKNKTELIGLVIPDVKHPFFATLTSYIENELDKRRYKMILCNTANSSEKEKEYIRMLQENKVDGMIIGSHSIDIDYSNINAPIVALDRYLDKTIPYVSANHLQGGELAAKYLIDNNCSKVLQIKGFSKVESPSNKRYDAFKTQMIKNNIEYSDYELDWNQFDFDSYIEVARDILMNHKDIDGIFSVDMVIIAILKEALGLGINVPEQLKLVGYDGTEISRMTYPTFPSVVQPFSEIAKQSVSLLDDLINKRKIQKLEYEIDVYIEDNK